MALREILAKFGFEVGDTSKLDDAKKKTDGLASGFKSLLGILAAKALIDSVQGFVSGMRDANTEIKRTAIQLGLSYDEMQRWQFAANMSGVEAEQLATGIKFLQKNLVEGAKGTGEQAEVFKKLGITIKDANGEIRPTGDLLRETGFAIAGIANPAERTAAVLKLFGRQGLALIPLFEKGADGLAELNKRFDELGGGIGPEASAALSKSKEASKEFDFAILGLKSRIITALLPALTSLVEMGTKVVVWFQQSAAHSNVFKAALIVLGGIATVVAIGMYAKFLPITIALALAILLVDDLITALEGGDSVIGSFLDKVLGDGKGSKNRGSIFGMIKDDIADMNKSTKDLDFVDTVLADLGTVASGIGRFFSDTLPSALDQGWKDLNDRFETGGQTAGDFFFYALEEALNGINDWVFDTAASIVDSLTDGAMRNQTKFIDAMKNMARDAVAGILAVFRIGSPSKVMLDIADNVTSSFSNRVDENSDDVKGSMVNTFGDAVAPLASQRFAPPAAAMRASAGGPVDRSASVDQRNTIYVQLPAGSGRSTAEDARQGIVQGLGDGRREMLAALETVAEGEG